MAICVPIRVKTAKEALKIATIVRKRGILLVEIWMDLFSAVDLATVFRKLKKPFILKSNDVASLTRVCGSRPTYIDVDYFERTQEKRKLIKKAHSVGSKVIVSFHDFKKTPSINHLISIIEKGFVIGADVVKIATMVKNFEDNIILFELVMRMKTRKRKVIVLGMGVKGIISRTGCPLLGSFLAYVAYDKKHMTAPGQPVLLSGGTIT